MKALKPQVDHGWSYRAAVVSSIAVSGLLGSRAARCSAARWQSPACSGPAPERKGQCNSENNSAEWPWLPGAEPHSSQGEPGFSLAQFPHRQPGCSRSVQAILRPDSKGTCEVTESRFGCRMLVGILNLSLALGHYHWDMPCLSLPILQYSLYSSMETTVLEHSMYHTLHTCLCRDIPMWLAGDGIIRVAEMRNPSSLWWQCQPFKFPSVTFCPSPCFLPPWVTVFVLKAASVFPFLFEFSFICLFFMCKISKMYFWLKYGEVSYLPQNYFSHQ